MSDSASCILVTGGAGFIGSHFVRQWVSLEESPVVNLDKLTYAGNLASLRPVMDNSRHVFVEGDICDRRLVPRLLDEHQPRAVIHFAAESHVDRSIDGPPAFVETNVLGTCHLLEAVRNYWMGLPQRQQHRFRFVHVSTDEVYGTAEADECFSESTPYAPNSPYAASKAAADHFVRAYFQTYGLPVIITNCSNNYGPYQFPEKMIPLMILNALAGRKLPVYGDGEQVRDWLFVEDHIGALRLVLAQGRPGEVYLIGGNHRPTNLEVVQQICSTVDAIDSELPHAPCSSLIAFVDDRPGHDRRYAVDSGKIERELGWKPQHDFHAGLRRTVQWYCDNRSWVDEVTSEVDATGRRGQPRKTRKS